MQMILIERFFSSANIIRTKAKVRVSPKGWRTVFSKFADCKYYSHEGKSAGQPQRLAHGLFKIFRVQILFARRQKCESAQKAGARSLEDLPSAKLNIILETCKRLTVFLFLYRLTKLRSFCIILIKFEYHE